MHPVARNTHGLQQNHVIDPREIAAGGRDPSMKSPPPTLMDLCLDALTRQPQQERKLQESCGSFWCAAAAMGDEPKVLAPLPLPASVKAAALGKLRRNGGGA